MREATFLAGLRATGCMRDIACVGTLGTSFQSWRWRELRRNLENDSIAIRAARGCCAVEIPVRIENDRTCGAFSIRGSP